MIFIVSQKNLPNIILQKKFHTLRVSNKFAQYLETKWQHFVIIQEIEILFHNVYKETLLIFRSKKLNIGKVFSFLLFFFFSQFFYEVITQFLRWYLGTFLVSIQFRILISPFIIFFLADQKKLQRNWEFPSLMLIRLSNS